jgi:hypothetical protein
MFKATDKLSKWASDHLYALPLVQVVVKAHRARVVDSVYETLNETTGNSLGLSGAH